MILDKQYFKNYIQDNDKNIIVDFESDRDHIYYCQRIKKAIKNSLDREKNDCSLVKAHVIHHCTKEFKNEVARYLEACGYFIERTEEDIIISLLEFYEKE